MPTPSRHARTPEPADTPQAGVQPLHALLAGLDAWVARPEDGDTPIASVVESSREAQPGSLFIARPGVRADGRAHIAEAVERGAVAVLVQDGAMDADLAASVERAREAGVAIVRAADAARAGALAIERSLGEPSHSLGVVAATGTNGKTTVAWLTRRLLDAVGIRCGLISTVGVDAGAGLLGATHTTPPASAISRALRDMLDAGCCAAAVEASSHALHQGRLSGVRVRVGVFTNLSGDHLDYHDSMDAYADAKASLFASLPVEGLAVVNADDPASQRMLRDCSCSAVACALGEGAHAPKGAETARVSLVDADATGAALELAGPWGTIRARSPLVGEHNAMNLLQALCAAHALGAPVKALERAIPHLDAPPGRFERIEPRQGAGEAAFTLLVDYAHTDDALKRALAALRPITPAGARLIVVFGAGGDRDRAKRPRMGAVAADLADVVFVTSDNPRTEDPDAIIADVLAGMPAPARAAARAIADREQAILAAVDEARAGDMVLIAGKGHEDYQILPDGAGGTITRAFDDRVIARQALARRAARAQERVA